MAFRDFERAAIKKLAEIEKMGDFVTRQKILAARLWAKERAADETVSALPHPTLPISVGD